MNPEIEHNTPPAISTEEFFSYRTGVSTHDTLSLEDKNNPHQTDRIERIGIGFIKLVHGTLIIVSGTALFGHYAYDNDLLDDPKTLTICFALSLYSYCMNTRQDRVSGKLIEDL